ncbi:hypothetical protein HYW17_01980 [Candidatus Uhrbacteria bacterium]|nr:hypothetical protein [Candidatus Uhrbacteria bacterium]
MSEELLNKILIKLIDLDVYVREHTATKEEMQASEDRMLTHIDGFIKLHETLDLELVALRSKVDRVEERVGKIEMRLSMAST